MYKNGIMIFAKATKTLSAKNVVTRNIKALEVVMMVVVTNGNVLDVEIHFW